MIINDVIDKTDIEVILNTIIEKYPQLLNSNNHIETDDESLNFITMIPKMHIENLGEPLCLILLSTIDNKSDYAGKDWHVDGLDDETSVILYLKGDNTCGGEFSTKDNTYSFKPGSMIVIPSNVLHKVEPYNSENSRIAVKWKFK
jgi:mannose-6-phosphate isomerase-like protein (cupin superfamily)